MLRAIVVLSLVCGSLPLRADDLSGPFLGYLPETSNHAVRPVRGLPGAATAGDALELGDDVTAVAISPSQACLLMTTTAGARFGTLTASGELRAATAALPGGAAVSLIAFSPTGSNAAIYDAQARVLYASATSDCPASTLRAIDLGMVPGTVARLAISDGSDPLVAGITTGDSPLLFVVDPGGNYRALPDLGAVSSIAFLARSRDLAAARDKREIVRLREPLAGGAPESLVTVADAMSDLRIASSVDGRVLAITDGSASVRLFDFASGTLGKLDCGCTPSVLESMRGHSVFRLTAAGEWPAWLLDADGPEPRLVFVPPAAAPEVQP